MKLRRLFILILLIASLVPLPHASAADPWASAYTDWQYRVPITISNSLVDVLTDFQVKIVLNSTNFNFSHAKSDGSDIRFALANGTTVPYWIEKWDYTNQQAVVWIKVPEIPSNGQTVVYMYYGNGAAASESNGDAVFEFFDDFDGTSLNTTKWTASGSVSVANGEVTLTGTSTADAYIYSVQTFAQGAVLEARARATYLNTYGLVGEGFVSSDVSNAASAQAYKPDGYYRVNSKSAGTATTALTDLAIDSSYHIFTVIWTTSEVTVIVDDTHTASVTDTTYIPTVSMPIRMRARGGVSTATSTLDVDWVFVRKYAAQDPAVSIGSEEQITQATITFSFSDSLGNTLNNVNVYVNGSLLGVFNNSDSVTLQAGSYTFVFEKQGYNNVTKVVDLQNDTTISVVFMPTNPITVTFDFQDDLGTTLNNVSLYIDGKLYGQMDSGDSVILATPGNHTFSAEKNHYVTAQKTVELQNDTTLTLTLDRESYLVYFYAYDYNNTELNTFNVYANGTLLGVFSSGGSALVKYGTYIFKFEKQGYRSTYVTQTIDAPGAQVTFYNIMPSNIYSLTLSFYDALNNTKLDNVNVTINGALHTLNSGDSLALAEGNYTLIFEKQGYESRNLSLELTNDITMSVYLSPVNTTNAGSEQPEFNLTSTPVNGTLNLPSDYADYGFKGAKLGELFVQGKWSEVYQQFWHYDPLAEIVLPILFSLGLIIAGFIYTRSPLVPIGVTAIMMTFFHLLGMSLSISLVTPLASLFVFFIVWALWDFYKRFERS